MNVTSKALEGGRLRLALLAAAVAVLAIVGSAAVLLGQDSEAAYSSSDVTVDYGDEIYEVDLAYGYTYTYTPSYPSDLTVTTSIYKYESAYLSATVSSGTLTVALTSAASAGSSYDIILMATTSTGGITQTAYQYIRINAVASLSASASISDIVAGDSDLEVELSASAGTSGTITWTASNLPDGLTFDGSSFDGSESLSAGTYTVTLTASLSTGESYSVDCSFTVWSQITAGSSVTLTSYGSTVTSSAIAQASDLSVTWAVTSGTLPDGASLDASTGQVTWCSTASVSASYTITGTDANSGQTTSFTLTLVSDELYITGSEAIYGVVGSTQVYTYYASVSGVTWTADLTNVPTGATVTLSTYDGYCTLTVTGTNSTDAFTVTLTATATADGSDASETITVTILSQLTFTSAPTNGTVAYVLG